jgi:hypothetical protein
MSNCDLVAGGIADRFGRVKAGAASARAMAELIWKEIEIEYAGRIIVGSYALKVKRCGFYPLASKRLLVVVGSLTLMPASFSASWQTRERYNVWGRPLRAAPRLRDGLTTASLQMPSRMRELRWFRNRAVVDHRPLSAAALGADVGLLGDALARAGQHQLLRVGAERLRCAHAVDPGATNVA